MQLSYKLFALCLLPSVLIGTELKPWFGEDHEAEIRANLLYQQYDEISSGHNHHKHVDANDGFLTGSILYPFKRYCGEFEAVGALTHKQQPGWDCFRLTGRYLVLDETACDAINLTVGITLSEPFEAALHDISSFHHGYIEAEGHFAFGKSYGWNCTNEDFTYRWWQVFGVGVADKGAPWLRGDYAFEYKYAPCQLLRLFVNTLWGSGPYNLDPDDFTGYGMVKHKSIDVGLRYTLGMGCWGTLSAQYARRVFARNFPQNANLVMLEYFYPFGQQTYTSY